MEFKDDFPLMQLGKIKATKSLSVLAITDEDPKDIFFMESVPILVINAQKQVIALNRTVLLEKPDVFEFLLKQNQMMFAPTLNQTLQIIKSKDNPIVFEQHVKTYEF